MCLVEALKEDEFNTEFRFEILKEDRWRESKERERVGQRQEDADYKYTRVH